MHVASFTFNPFGENTYILYDESRQCIIVDPGCSTVAEQTLLKDFVTSSSLTPVGLVNTHCHIDHVLGNRYVVDLYSLPLTSHRGEQQVLDMQPIVSDMYGIPYEASPAITVFLEEGDKLSFGNTDLDVIFTPGHSPASISFYHAPSHQLIAGDVLFRESIGRTDLPGGNMETLLQMITTKLFVLADETIVYSGHGPSTTIGHEKQHNPFLQ